ncbi:peptide ABC transporter substrate-binding protein [Paratractidigestivibacter sp.]|uniref:peptide ABC transporter substrate-binding protein n=1 Tax=Paratractidigestivibacter sp. TaxID=2847316 RepID=UPI003AB64D49
MALDRNGGGVSRRTFVKGSLAASALAALAACGKNNNGASANGGTVKASEGGTFKYYISDPVAIDHYNLQESEGTQVGHVLFDSLVEWDWDKGDVKAKAAESWEINDDNTVFTFHLKDAKFHNGDPVTSESFKRGWQRLVDTTMTTPGEIGYHLAPVVGYDEMAAGEATELTGLTCPDDKTFVVTLKEPMADFLAVCCHPGLAPAPQAAIDDAANYLLAPIGNGPFMMDGKWESGQYINVKRFDDYYGDKPALDAINFSIQKDPKTAYSELEAGNMDFCQIPTGRFAELTEKYGSSVDGYTISPSRQTLAGAEASVYYLAVNLEDETMANKDLRHAIGLAINRQNIVDTLFEGVREPADNVFPPIIDKKGGSWEYAKYDPEAAKKIIDEKGLAGTTIKLNYNSGGGHEDIMSCIQADLTAVGLNVEQDTKEWAAYLQSLTDGDFQMGRLGWIADYPTLDNFIFPNFYSTADNNYSRYNNPEVDAAIDDARKIADEDERKDAYRKINQMVADDMPIIPIMFYAHQHVASDRVNELYYNAQGIADLGHASLRA